MKYLIIFSIDKKIDINNLKNFIAVYVSNLKSLHKTAAELINNKHQVFCLLKDSYLSDFDLKSSNVQYFNSHYGTYVLLEINLEGK
jgi:hypothetical protein